MHIDTEDIHVRAVIQRVNSARVYADGAFSGECERGLYILLGVSVNDTERDAELLAEKIPKLRIFSDQAGKMNLSALDVGAEALVVSNFTLYANYRHGNRPDYLTSAPPERARELYNYFLTLLSARIPSCRSGVFGADMRTEMSTDGPVTIVMDSELLRKN